MPKATTPQSTTPPNPRWKAFTRANVRIKQIVSRGYAPVHNRDRGHHARIVPDNIVHHINEKSGGGFQMILEHSDKPWPGFAKLGEQGVDINDLRCEWCNDELVVDATRIQQHMKPHIGQRKMMKTGNTGIFNITLVHGERTMVSDQELTDAA